MAHTCIKQALTPGHAGGEAWEGSNMTFQVQLRMRRLREEEALARASAGRTRAPSQAANLCPRQLGPGGHGRGWVSARVLGRAGPGWSGRARNSRERTGALASGPSGPVQVRRKKCPHSFVCKLSCLGVRSKGWGVRVEGGAMCL